MKVATFDTYMQEQQDIILHPALSKFLICGRRWGKTVTAMMYVLHNAQYKPKQDTEIVSPKYSLATKIFTDFKRSDGFMGMVKRTSLTPVPHFELINGHIVYFRSMDRPETLKGGPLTLAIIDEASQVAWSDIQEHIFPKLSDLNGTLFCCSTPLGENGWLWQKHLQYKNGSDPNCATWCYPTWTNYLRYGDGIPGNISVAGRNRLKYDRSQVTKDQWDQEYACRPLPPVGGMFRWVKECTRKSDTAPVYNAYNYGIVASVDVAKTNDHSAVVVLMVDLRQDIAHVIHAERIPRHKKWETIVDDVASILSRYGSPLTSIDTTGGAKGGQSSTDAILPLFLNSNKIKNLSPFNWTGDNKSDIMEYLALKQEQGKIYFYEHQKDLLEELAQFKRVHHGIHTEYTAPKGLHDDLVAALALAVHSWRHKRYSKNVDMSFSPSVSWF